jgi:plastocyanin
MLLVHVVADADPSPTPAPASAAASPVADTGKPVEVNTYHFAYTPNPVTVAVGTKVTFKNSDAVAHTVTSEDGGDKPAFDSGDMPQNATWSHIFAKAGTYNYYCAYHSYMKATVVVK